MYPETDQKKINVERKISVSTPVSQKLIKSFERVTVLLGYHVFPHFANPKKF